MRLNPPVIVEVTRESLAAAVAEGVLDTCPVHEEVSARARDV